MYDEVSICQWAATLVKEAFKNISKICDTEMFSGTLTAVFGGILPAAHAHDDDTAAAEL